MISNEFAARLCLKHEVKNEDKVVKKELIVALRGEIYFVKFIINPEDDDIEPGVVLERSFLSVMLDKLKLDGEVEADEEEATKEVIKGYKTLREKDDPRVFVLPIRLEAKINSFALADTCSNINVMPYQIYTKLYREDAKPIAKKITMFNHSKAEPMGI
ncbi:hypothetical protein Tco_0593293 [Tanacetum coccineum]